MKQYTYRTIGNFIVDVLVAALFIPLLVYFLIYALLLPFQVGVTVATVVAAIFIFVFALAMIYRLAIGFRRYFEAVVLDGDEIRWIVFGKERIRSKLSSIIALDELYRLLDGYPGAYRVRIPNGEFYIERNILGFNELLSILTDSQRAMATNGSSLA